MLGLFSCFRNPPNSDTDGLHVTWVRDHSYPCVYTRELGTPTASQRNIFDSEQLSQIVLVLLTGFEPWVFGIVSPTLSQLSHPVLGLPGCCSVSVSGGCSAAISPPGVATFLQSVQQGKTIVDRSDQRGAWCQFSQFLLLIL